MLAKLGLSLLQNIRLENMRSTPCKFYQRGYCMRGEGCRFSHTVAAGSSGGVHSSSAPPFHHRKVYSSESMAVGGALSKHWEFRVMSYNILADQYAQEHKRELYSSVPHSALDWPRRKRLIVKEVEQWRPDIVCFQEVDHYPDLEQALKAHGYSGVYTQRTGGRPDGLATFYKSSIFALAENKDIYFAEMGLKDNVSQVIAFKWLNGSTMRPLSAMETNEQHVDQTAAALARHIRFEDSDDDTAAAEDNNESPCLIVSNIHVLFNPKRGDIKLAQVRTMLEAAHQLSIKHKSAPVVVCGDFNSAAGSPLYNYIVNQQLDLEQLDRKRLSGQVESQGQGWPGTIKHRFLAGLDYNAKNGDGDTKHQVFVESQALSYAYAQLPKYNSLTDPYRSPEAPMFQYTQTVMQANWQGTPIDRQSSDGAMTSGTSSIKSKGGSATKRGWTEEELDMAIGGTSRSAADTVARHPLQLESAYNSALGQEPHYSTVHDKYLGTVDYIFYTPEGPHGQSDNRFVLEASTVLQPPSLKTLHSGLPSNSWPSDHICLVVGFDLHKAA